MFGVQGLVLNRLVVWVQGSASSSVWGTGVGPESSSGLGTGFASSTVWGTGVGPESSSGLGTGFGIV